MAETPLTGWKEIAAFLRSSVRTVQRFERELGLPIHRTQPSKGAVVRAYPSELAKWLDERGSETAAPGLAATATSGNERRPARLMISATRRVALAVSVVLSLAILGAWVWRSFASKSMSEDSVRTAAGSEQGTAALVGTHARRVWLTIRPGLASPLRMAGPDGGRLEIALRPGLEVSLRPTVQGTELLLGVDRRLHGNSDFLPVGTLHLVAGASKRLVIDGTALEVTWDSDVATNRH